VNRACFLFSAWDLSGQGWSARGMQKTWTKVALEEELKYFRIPTCVLFVVSQLPSVQEQEDSAAGRSSTHRQSRSLSSRTSVQPADGAGGIPRVEPTPKAGSSFSFSSSSALPPSSSSSSSSSPPAKPDENQSSSMSTWLPLGTVQSTANLPPSSFSLSLSLSLSRALVLVQALTHSLISVHTYLWF